MKQKGNALWFILVAIALLGLLTIMMSRTSSTSNETGNFERNSVLANNILSYAKNMENAVQSLLARGCSENEISFWHDSDGNGVEDASDDYFNTETDRPDRSCHVFDTAGTGLSWEEPNEQWLDSSEDTSLSYNSFIINSKNNVTNLEQNSNDDLIILLNWLEQDVCQAINQIIFSDTTITEDLAAFNYTADADGVFDTVSANINLSSYAPHDGQPTACFTSEDDGGFHFYHALHAR
jgi:hypothetical protein